ncbi:sodium:solute symporter family transporter [Yeosuana sp.]|uniref:sodium:solute symporter family transporter n=1 Tax=Yeosuana sp. TaxID=2529388 RepID=UPI0040550A5A
MILAWSLFIVYLLGTSYLGYLGYKKTRGFSSFAIGNGDLSPFVVGVTLAASTASAATFIINPGFVYVDGLSAWINMVLGTFTGIMFMLVVLSFKFRRIGEKMKALTVPDWIGKHYNSKEFSLYFAFINLLSFAFVVLLVGGISIVMQKLLDVNNVTALIITLVFVTGYVFFGGTYAHVYTNMFQGLLMIIVTIIILWSGIELLMKSSDPGFFQQIYNEDPNLLVWINKKGALFNDFFSIYVTGFFIGAAVVSQPHILTKALYVKSDQAVKKYLWIFGVILFLFLLLTSVGFFAHVSVPADQFTDVITGKFRQDLVMIVYLAHNFPDWVFTLISIVLLAAAMSTLDGLLVSISTITANDMILNILDKFTKKVRTEEQKMKIAFNASHIILVVIAILVFWVNLNPPKLLGIYGQVGVYGMVLAALPPLLIGILFKKAPIKIVWTASIIAMFIHFVLYLYGNELFPDSTFTFVNPAVTATLAILTSVLPTVVLVWILNIKAKTNE